MAVRHVAWAEVASNASWSMFVHGFTANESVLFSIVVFPGTGAGVPNPVAHATLTQGESFQHVDGTKAYKAYVRNNAAFNSCHVHLVAQVESF